MYNVGYQLFNPIPGQMYQPIQTVMTDRALINQRLQALMNMSCLRMRGLPFSALQKDVLGFLGNFSDHVIGAVHIIYNLQVSFLFYLEGELDWRGDETQKHAVQPIVVFDWFGTNVVSFVNALAKRRRKRNILGSYQTFSRKFIASVPNRLKAGSPGLTALNFY